jgi:predicted alpha-1,6-mannanase (GH76 family)
MGIQELCRRAATTLAVAGCAAVALTSSAQAADHRVSAQAKSAAETVMRWYDPSTGLWKTTNWWNAANILTGLMDLDLEDHTHRYADVAATTYAQGVSQQGGNFTNEYNDDTGWWGLAWLRAYELTGRKQYLATAIADAEAIWSYRDDVCGGGIWWNHDKGYKNSITNELFIKLAAQLHNTLPDDTVWLDRAEQTWRWFRDSGLINPDHSISDGLNGDCRNDGTTAVYSYNQGVILGALVELDKAGDAEALPMADRIARSAVTSPTLAPGGILADPGEPQSSGGADGPTFKGVFTRNLGELDRHEGGRPLYREFLQRQARSLIGHDRNDADQYGYHWAGPFDTADAARQGSALDALVAAEPDRVLTLAAKPAYPGGPVVVAPGESGTLTTSFSNGGRTPATSVAAALEAPAGWTATPLSRAGSDRVLPGDSLTTSWRLEPPAGAAPGTYTIGSVVRYRTPGEPGTQSVTASTRVLVPNPPSRCVGAGAGFCPLDLSRDYNHDGVATLESTSDGNFDDLGWSFAANLLPPAGPVTLGGVPYEAPSTAATDANFVEGNGQPLVLGGGSYAVAHVLGATHGGNVDTTATVLYTDGSTASVPLRLTDWASGPAFGNTKAIPMAYRIKAGKGQDGPPVSIFATTMALDASKTVRWIVMPSDPRVEVYALTLGG